MTLRPIQPLKNIKIIDASRILAGPLCSMVLSDLGAEVVKIESPQGDDTRTWGPPFVDGMSTYFAAINRGKRSVALDLKNAKDQEKLAFLLGQSDVLIENFLPSSARRLGLDPETVKKRFPQLVHASITGFGHHTKASEKPGYDFIIQALSGLMAITGEPGGTPMKVGVALVDVMTGLYTAIGILAELSGRDRLGREPVHVDVSLWQSALASLVNVASAHLMADREAQRLGNAHPQIVPYESFATRDGNFVLAVGNDVQFREFCQLIKKPALMHDQRFATNPARVTHRMALIGELAPLFRQRSNAEWTSLLAPTAIPHGPVQTVGEAFTWAESLDTTVVVQDSAGHKHVRSPLVRGDATPLAPPGLGEHTADVLRDWGWKK